MSHEECIFCRILDGELPGEVVMEDEQTVALLDINPWTRGHAIVIPRKHVENVYEIADEDLGRVNATGARLARRMRDVLGADGINLLNSTGTAAWQTVFHFHLHVIPRYEGDPLELPVHPGQADPGELADVAEELRA